MAVPRFWRNIEQRYRNAGTECRNCETAYFPPRKLCPNCRRDGDIVEREFSGEGEVVTHTEVHDPGEDFDGSGPYTLAIVELDDGPRVTAQIVGDGDVAIGDRVERCFRKVGEEGEAGMIHYGTKFTRAD